MALNDKELSKRTRRATLHTLTRVVDTSGGPIQKSSNDNGPQKRGLISSSQQGAASKPSKSGSRIRTKKFRLIRACRDGDVQAVHLFVVVDKDPLDAKVRVCMVM
jgi:hypothetical protein